MILILVVAVLPRVLDLGIFLTADEKNWLGRSFEFIRAFREFRFNDMLQTTHPGVTTLWIGGLAITLRTWMTGVPFSFNDLVHFLWVTQLPIALVSALVIPIAYGLMRLLFRHRGLAALAALLMALNPFLIGYARVVHVDALLASFMLLACLSFLLYLKNDFSRWWLIIFAFFSGLALLTKIPAVFLIPFFWCGVILKNYSLGFSKSFWWQRIKDFLWWLVVVVVMFAVLWPVFIVVPDPIGNALILKRDISIAAITPHHMSEDYTLNPWHYLGTLVTRTTPWTFVFSIIFLIWVIFVRLQPGFERQFWWLLTIFVVGFILMMTLGAKKGDRYILPVFPILDILAAAGVWYVVKLSSRELLKWSVIVVLITSLIITAWRYHPYAIAYSNPLFPDNLSQELGWGEGLEQVGSWLNREDPSAVVASWYPEELRAFTSAQVAHINAHEQFKVNYVVLYRNMFGRAADHPANNFIDEYYKKKEPVFVAEIVGKEFAWVYEKPVYEQVVGELVPGKQVGQKLLIDYPQLEGVDLAVATYSGKATIGSLVVRLRHEFDGRIVQEWRYPIKDIEDARWLRLSLPEPLNVEGQTLVIEIEAEQTTVGNAPTIRYSRLFDARPSGIVIAENGDLNSSVEKPGDLAVQLRYRVGTESATEHDTKLLQATFGTK